MTPDQFFTPLNGQSLLYPGQAEIYRAQCVQSVMLWLAATGTPPPIYLSAVDYYTNGIPGYIKVPAGGAILEGDIIVWGSNFPPAAGNGHIDVASANGTIASFSAWDSNWAPLKLAHILHNGSDNNYIAGYLRKGNMSMTRTGMATLKFVAVRQTGDITDDEYLKYKDDTDGWAQYLQDVQVEHHLAPQPFPPPVTTDNFLPYVPPTLYVKEKP